MKLLIHITRHIDSIAEGEELFQQVLEQFANDPFIHVNAIADHNFKHPEQPDADQTSNPHARQNHVNTQDNPA